MSRALFIKEWTQLRSMRWVGLGLGVLLPLFLLAGAEAARQGWFAGGIASEYNLRTIFVSAMPRFLVGVWALLALLVTGQVFAGDRASGVESFLLERPVPRRRIWAVRLVATVVTLAVIFVGHLVVWAAMTQIAASPRGGEWSEAFTMLSGGVVAAALGLLGGLAAATLLKSPIQAVLLGLVLAVLPAGMASVLGGRFPMAAIGHLPIGLLLPLLLLVGYLVASYRSSCRGEPAGRGRIARGVVVLVVAVVAVPLVFAVTAPLSVRFNSKLGANYFVESSPTGKSAVVLTHTYRRPAGWLVDLESQRLTRFLPPPVEEAVWNADGSRVAVLHSSGRFGALRPGYTLDFYDINGDVAAQSIEFPHPYEWPEKLVWHGDRLLAKAPGMRGESRLLVIDPGDGSIERIAIDAGIWEWSLHGPAEDHSMFVHMLVDRDEAAYVLRRVDFEQRRIDPAVLVSERGIPTYAPKLLSPAGRYWMRVDRDQQNSVRLWDLETSTSIELDGAANALWLADDRLLVTRLGADRGFSVGPPEGPFKTLKRWDQGLIYAVAAPGGERALLQIWQAPPGSPPVESGLSWSQIIYKEGAVVESWVCEIDALDPCVELPSSLGETKAIPGALTWAGPTMLAVRRPGELAIKDIRSDDPPRYLFGR